MAQALHFFLRKMLISSRCKNTGIEQVPEDVISEAQRHDQTISPGRVEGSFFGINQMSDLTAVYTPPASGADVLPRRDESAQIA